MKNLLSTRLIVSLMRYVTENENVDPSDLNKQYEAFNEQLQALVDERCPLIQILRQLAFAAIELRTLQDKVKKKCALPNFSG